MLFRSLKGLIFLIQQGHPPLAPTPNPRDMSQTKFQISSLRFLATLKNSRINLGEMSTESSCPQDSNGEEIILIRQRVRELSKMYSFFEIRISKFDFENLWCHKMSHSFFEI